MPGISLMISINNIFENYFPKIINIQESMNHNKDYYNKIIYNDSKCFLGYTRYNEYPINIFENKRFLIVIEGIIYNKHFKEIKNKFLKYLKKSYFSKKEFENEIKKFLFNSDGDFVIIILDKYEKKIIILNDLLGRLPTYYYYKKNNIFLFSREVKFLTSLINKIIFNKNSIAEYLIFGYPLGNKTFIKNIFRMEYATIIYIDISNLTTEFSKIYNFNFENKLNINFNKSDHINELKKLFLRSCKYRVSSLQNFKHILSLSGGLDSRTVAAAFKELDVKFNGITFFGFGAEKNEIKRAKCVSEILEINWKLLYPKKPNLNDIKYLLYIKDGLNYAGMSFILSFFNQIKKLYGNNVVYYTGDGGDKLIPDIKPKKKLKKYR